MRITDAASLMQKLEAKSAMTVDRHGALKTESKIFSALRNLFSSKQAVAARNAKLNEKMAEVLRASNLPNVAEAFVRRSSDAGYTAGASRALLAVDIMTSIASSQLSPRIAMQEAEAMVSKLPKGMKALVPAGMEKACAQTAARIAMAAVEAKGAAANMSEARRIARAVMADIAGDPVKVKALSHGYEAGAEELQPLMDGMAGQVKERFAKAREQAQGSPESFKDGVYHMFFKDANRHSIRSIGKEPSPAEDGGLGAAAQLKAAFGDKYASFLPFVSYVVCQSGIEHVMTGHLMGGDPKTVPVMELAAVQFASPVGDHCFDIDVRDGKCHIRSEMDSLLVARGIGDTKLTTEEDSFGLRATGGRYVIDIVIDLEQDMTGKAAPDFSISATRSTIPEFTHAPGARPEPPAAMMQDASMADRVKHARGELGEAFEPLIGAGLKAVRPVPDALRAAMSPPLAAGALARELAGLAKAFGAGLAGSMTEQQAERAQPHAALGLMAMIHDVPGLADLARASAAELAAAVDLAAGQDPDPVLQTLAEVIREL